MKPFASTLILLTLCYGGFTGTASAAGKYFVVDYPASTNEGALQIAVTYTVWIPDGVTQLRGLIVHQHGAGTTAALGGATAAYDLHWQALAKKWDCALMGPSYHVLNEKTDASPGASELWFDPRRGSEKVFLKALDDLGAKSGHAELPLVPWALWGHSAGGTWANLMLALHPDRILAVWLRSGSAIGLLARSELPPPKFADEVYSIPLMGNAGVLEKGHAYEPTLNTFKQYRAKGAPIGFAPDPRTPHWCGDQRYLAIPWFDACLAMRLPDQGNRNQKIKPVDLSTAWLAEPLSETAVPAAVYKGDAREAVWLPNALVAKAWMEYVKLGTTIDTTWPPAPTNVKAAVKGTEGVEITWDAEVDWESGIGGFVVLRDGKGLAKMPTRAPVRVYGRPLWQTMGYHDTPETPLPEMRYLDAMAKPGEKHTYTVVTLNGAGLQSDVSTGATVP